MTCVPQPSSPQDKHLKIEPKKKSEQKGMWIEKKEERKRKIYIKKFKIKIKQRKKKKRGGEWKGKKKLQCWNKFTL